MKKMLCAVLVYSSIWAIPDKDFSCEALGDNNLHRAVREFNDKAVLDLILKSDPAMLIEQNKDGFVPGRLAFELLKKAETDNHDSDDLEKIVKINYYFAELLKGLVEETNF